MSTGNFALLGADLCRVTKDMNYCDRSYENVWWIDRQLKNDKGMIYDGLEGTTCKITDWQFTCKFPPALLSSGRMTTYHQIIKGFISLFMLNLAF